MKTIELTALVLCMQSAYSVLLQLQLMVKLLVKLQKEQEEIMNMLSEVSKLRKKRRRLKCKEKEAVKGMKCKGKEALKRRWYYAHRYYAHRLLHKA